MLSAVLLQHSYLYSSYDLGLFSFIVFLKIKPIVVRQVLDGRLIEVRTMGQLLLKRQKGGSDCLIAVAAQSRFNFPLFTTTGLWGHWLLMITGRLLMGDGRLKWFNCIIEVATQSRFNSPFFTTIISGHWLLAAQWRFNCIQSGMLIMLA